MKGREGVAVAREKKFFPLRGKRKVNSLLRG